MNTYLNGLFDLAIDKGMAFGRCLGVHISRPCMDIDTVFMLTRPLLCNPHLVLLGFSSKVLSEHLGNSKHGVGTLELSVYQK
jgi:hypothetical protein